MLFHYLVMRINGSLYSSLCDKTGGQLYAATVADFSGGEPLIHREKIRTERSDLNQLNGK